ncbi:hypothetical protein CPT_Phriendly_036 [Vibrio phage Phriendly]|nr:hypothetical protein CPT_Phriendly_036 [Vibrio phage Phriendly]
MNIGIPQINKPNKEFAKVVKQADPVEGGMYKAIFNRFVTLGFQKNDFEEDKIQFITVFGFELVEDMAGNKVPNHWQEFDDGTRKEGAKTVTREYPLNDQLHHKSNGFSIAKSLDPQVPTIRKGKENEHEYIVDFNWEEHLGKTVLLQINKKKAKAGHFYNQIQGVMPLGVPLAGELPTVFFNLYNPEMEDVWKDSVYPWEKKKIRERVLIPGEPAVVYGNDAEPMEAPKEEPKVEEPKAIIDEDKEDNDLPF